MIIRDGWGVAPAGAGNAVSLARTPVLDRLLAEAPHALLGCSGEAVGLPPGVMGNSEVGHMNFGAGRIVHMDLTRIDRAIADGSFGVKAALAAALEAARGRALHLLGLCSDGLVHASLGHLRALLVEARRRGLERVFLHAITDGRDTAPDSGRGFIAALESMMAELGVGRIATVMGRFYAMDRDRRWERVRVAWEAMVAGRGALERSAAEAVASSYAQGVTDEFIVPRVIADGAGEPLGRVREGDVVICFNFRADRVRELTRALTRDAFDGFERPGGAPRVHYLCMTRYDQELDLPLAFGPQEFQRTLAEVVSGAGLRQLRMAETEKYAHVTFFFSCGREEPWEGEERLLVPSPQVATYDLQPEMSAEGLTEELLARIRRGAQDLAIVNYANADMLGHTGVIPAAIQALETVDACIGRVLEAATLAGVRVLITADHGNVEQMIDPLRGGPHTAHTTHPVHLILVHPPGRHGGALAPGRLCDVAPTILELLAIPKPEEMLGRSLLATA